MAEMDDTNVLDKLDVTKALDIAMSYSGDAHLLPGSINN